MSQSVLNVIINKSQLLEIDLWSRSHGKGKFTRKKALSIYVSHGPQSNTLLLKETINLFTLTSLASKRKDEKYTVRNDSPD